MLFDEEIETLRYGSILNIQEQPTKTDSSAQLNAVNSAFPDATITQFIPSKTADIANRFSIQTDENKQLFVTVNQYNAQVLGTIDRSNSVYATANKIHSTLLMGDLGDYLIEIAASLGVLLIVSGVYLWIPNSPVSRAGFLKLRIRSGRRVLLRDLHANIAGILSVILFLFLLSGLSWTGIWGAKIVQAWNTFPTHYVWGARPSSESPEPHTHADLNHGSEEEMPWNLELTPVPESSAKAHDHAKMLQGDVHSKHTSAVAMKNAVSIDSIVDLASNLGFSQYRVFLPQSESGVYTITANSMAGDITDPANDRTVHVDQYSGKVLMDVTWQDYSAVAKLVAMGVSLHQGDVGTVNKLLNALFCLSFIFVAVSGAIMWWIRRPSRRNSLGVPRRFKRDGVWTTGLITLILISLLFPLSGIAIAIIFALDYLILSRQNARSGEHSV